MFDTWRSQGCPGTNADRTSRPGQDSRSDPQSSLGALRRGDADFVEVKRIGAELCLLLIAQFELASLTDPGTFRRVWREALFDALFVDLIELGNERRMLAERSPQRFIESDERLEFTATELVADLHGNGGALCLARGFPPVIRRRFTDPRDRLPTLWVAD